MQSYLIPAGQAEFSEEIKKSRFLTYLAPAHDVAQARLFIQDIKVHHPDARHHCWAFIAGAPWNSQALGCSDDGEPSGTAGKPMLGQLTGSGIGDIVAVVVRYYGGILLGTGGLVKAYGNGVQQALKLLVTERYVPRVAYFLHCDYHQLKSIESTVNAIGGEVVDVTYSDRVALTLCVPVTEVDKFVKKIRDIGKGSLLLSLVE